MKTIHEIKLKFEFKLQDMWMGLYWEKKYKIFRWPHNEPWYHVWIILIPTLPLHISFVFSDKEAINRFWLEGWLKIREAIERNIDKINIREDDEIDKIEPVEPVIDRF